MSQRAWCEVHHETTLDDTPGEWRLVLQWVTFHLLDGDQEGYRFGWRRPDGSFQAARGQARLPSFDVIRQLMDKATAEGWGHFDGQ